MLIPRQAPACIATNDGRMMVVGGVEKFTVEFYDPARNSWSFGSDLPIDIEGHQARYYFLPKKTAELVFSLTSLIPKIPGGEK